MLKKILNIMPYIAMAVILECLFVLAHNSENRIMYSGLLLATCFIGLIVYFKRNPKIRNIDILSLITTISYIILYLTIRFTTEHIKLPIMQEFGVGEIQWDQFASYFSLGYGLSQLFIGFILQYIGIAAIPICAIIVGLCYFLLSGQILYEKALLLRLLAGVFCAAGQVGFGFYLVKYWKRYFNVLFNLGVFIGIKVGATIGSIASKPLESGSMIWRELIKYIGFGMCGAGVLMGIVYIFVFFYDIKRNNKEDYPQVSEDNIINTEETNENTENQPSIWSSILNIKSLLLFLISWLVVIPYYGLQTGLLSYIGTDAFNMLNASALSLLFMPFIKMIFGRSLSMIVLSGCQIIGLFTMVFISHSPAVITFALITMGLSAQTHCLPPIIVGETYNTNCVAAMFGILNFCAMLLGCSITQKYMGTIIELIKVKIFGGFGTQAEHLFFLLKILIIPSVIAFILTIIYKYVDKSKD